MSDLARDSAYGFVALAAADHGTFADDVLSGLSADPPSLPPKWFYDDLGSLLFEAICATPEYYVPNVETALMARIGPEVARLVGPRATVLEYGAGAQVKTRLLLDALDQPSRLVALDIAGEFLAKAARSLASELAPVEVVAVHADFMHLQTLPAEALDGRGTGRVVAFMPGSTIGNLTRDEACAFLSRARGHVGPDGCFLIGVDLVKDPDLLRAAYDDAGGVTAAFNRNVLVRMARELGAEVDPAGFRHEARWNDAESRIEMHLVADGDQSIAMDDHRFTFTDGQSIHTENSHKYTVADFHQLARDAGFTPRAWWTDDAELFSIHMLAA